MSNSNSHKIKMHTRSLLIALLLILPILIPPQQDHLCISARIPRLTPLPPSRVHPAYLQNFTHIEQGCNWMGVAGQVFDKNGQPINRMVVRVEGFLGNQSLDALGMTSLATAYGPWRV
jgi:hypothetical protein